MNAQRSTQEEKNTRKRKQRQKPGQDRSARYNGQTNLRPIRRKLLPMCASMLIQEEDEKTEQGPGKVSDQEGREWAAGSTESGIKFGQSGEEISREPKNESRAIRVLQIYRSRERGEHSVEQLFLALDPWLQNDIGKRTELIGETYTSGSKAQEVNAPYQKSCINREKNQDIGMEPCLGHVGSNRFEIEKIELPEARYRSVRAIRRNVRFVKAYLRDHPADVIHITGEAYFLACFLPKDRTILTLHDLVYLDRIAEKREDELWDDGKERYLEGTDSKNEQANDRKEGQDEHRPGRNRRFRKPDLGKRVRYWASYWFWHRIPFERCRKIICVSDTVQTELLDRFPMIPLEKTCVIPNTVGEIYETSREQQLKIFQYDPFCAPRVLHLQSGSVCISPDGGDEEIHN